MTFVVELGDHMERGGPGLLLEARETVQRLGQAQQDSRIPRARSHFQPVGVSGLGQVSLDRMPGFGNAEGGGKMPWVLNRISKGLEVR